MNRNRAKELLPIIQAFAEGKDIQYKTELSNGWNKASYPIFSDEREYREYRIKPEPREFLILVSVDDEGVCVFHSDQNKTASQLSKKYTTVTNAEVVKVREVIE